MWDVWIRFGQRTRYRRVIRGLLVLGIAGAAVYLFTVMREARQLGGDAMTGVIVGTVIALPVVLLIARTATAAEDRARAARARAERLARLRGESAERPVLRAERPCVQCATPTTGRGRLIRRGWRRLLYIGTRRKPLCPDCLIKIVKGIHS